MIDALYMNELMHYLKADHILTACTELHSRRVSKYRSARFSSSLNLASACKQRYENTWLQTQGKKSCRVLALCLAAQFLSNLISSLKSDLWQAVHISCSFVLHSAAGRTVPGSCRTSQWSLGKLSQSYPCRSAVYHQDWSTGSLRKENIILLTNNAIKFFESSWKSHSIQLKNCSKSHHMTLWHRWPTASQTPRPAARRGPTSLHYPAIYSWCWKI